ncbi:hypothetical protein CBM2609_A140341 [Cupriavidus taiwanensis]|nr:hypothetical protein CBM2609_A140341 [Cupriavidus taiwanensis]SOZ44865.1 hypothetical protein CBM2610_A150339 [Cupriavidus taiwanensis]
MGSDLGGVNPAREDEQGFEEKVVAPDQLVIHGDAIALVKAAAGEDASLPFIAWADRGQEAGHELLDAIDGGLAVDRRALRDERGQFEQAGSGDGGGRGVAVSVRDGGIVEIPEGHAVGGQVLDTPICHADRVGFERLLAARQRLCEAEHAPRLGAGPRAAVMDALVRVALHERAIGSVECGGLADRAILPHAQGNVLAQVLAADLARAERGVVPQQQRHGARNRIDVGLARPHAGGLLGLGAERDQAGRFAVHLRQATRAVEGEPCGLRIGQQRASELRAVPEEESFEHRLRRHPRCQPRGPHAGAVAVLLLASAQGSQPQHPDPEASGPVAGRGACPGAVGRIAIVRKARLVLRDRRIDALQDAIERIIDQSGIHIFVSMHTLAYPVFAASLADRGVERGAGYAWNRRDCAN